MTQAFVCIFGVMVRMTPDFSVLRAAVCAKGGGLTMLNLRLRFA